MSAPLQSLCLRVRARHRSILPPACTTSCQAHLRSFHLTSIRHRGKKEEPKPDKIRGLVKGRDKFIAPRPSQIDAPRASSSRRLLESFEIGEEEIDKIINDNEENEYRTLLRQYGAALSPERPEDYDRFMAASGAEILSRPIDPGSESQMASRMKDQEKVIQAQERYLIRQQEVFLELPDEEPGFASSSDPKLEPVVYGDEPFEGDEMSVIGHGYLEQHREVREYYRLAAWELPLLTQYAKAFEPPSNETPLRFRYTSYLGEEHPSEKKVVVEFCTADLPLEPKQREKLVKLLGPRYNPQKDLVKMSCESFPEPAQNKRYLSDLIDSLLTEARCQSDAEHGKDAFDDVPVDFRHVKWKKEFKFPDAWKMTPDRRTKLFRAWTAEIGRAQQAMLDDSTVDGVKTIAQYLGSKPAVAAPQTVRVR